MKLLASTYFTELKQFTLGAKKRIWVSCYVATFNIRKKGDRVFSLFEILRHRQAAGVDVRFLIDRPRLHKPNYHAQQFLIRRLKSWGLPFWVAPSRTTCHAKVILIDDSVLLGSHNLAKSSLCNPLEISILVDDSPAITASVDRWFEECFESPDWEYYPPGLYRIRDVYP